MDAAEVEQILSVLESSLSIIKWRLKPSSKRRLETDILALCTEMRPVIMVDYGGKMPELQDHLCAFLKYCQQESSAFKLLQVMVIEDMIYMIHTKALAEFVQSSLNTETEVLLVDIEQDPPKMITPDHKRVPSAQLLSAQKLFSSVFPVNAVCTELSQDNKTDKMINGSSSGGPTASQSSGFIDLTSSIQETQVTVPTLNGWLLGYPVVYMLSKEHIEDAIYTLSMKPLHIFQILVRRNGGSSKETQRELLSFTVPYDLSTGGCDEPWAKTFIARMKARWERCKHVWESLQMECHTMTSTINLEEQVAPPARSEKIITSPAKPVLNPMSRPTTTTVRRTERPVEPFNLYQAYTRHEEETPIGNPKAIAALKLEGHLGIFYDRNRTTRSPTPVEIDFNNIRGATYRVIGSVLSEQARLSKEVDVHPIDVLIQDAANALANGVCVLIYMKLRVVNYDDPALVNHYRRKPNVPVPFEVPQPYALAISQLGALKLSGMVNQLYLTPTVPAGYDTNFGCPPANPWSPDAYDRAVKFAKKLGMRFSSVDLTVTKGSSWWIFRPKGEADTFVLECPYPEENFTEIAAVLATLFMNNENGGFNNPVINLASLGADVYGTMLRNPPANISIDTYNAVVEVREIV